MILLWLECDAAGVTDISLETVAFARSLAAAGGGIAIRAALIGEVPEAARDQLAAHGVDEVHHVSGPSYDAWPRHQPTANMTRCPCDQTPHVQRSPPANSKRH